MLKCPVLPDELCFDSAELLFVFSLVFYQLSPKKHVNCDKIIYNLGRYMSCSRQRHTFNDLFRILLLFHGLPGLALKHSLSINYPGTVILSYPLPFTVAIS